MANWVVSLLWEIKMCWDSSRVFSLQIGYSYPVCSPSLVSESLNRLSSRSQLTSLTSGCKGCVIGIDWNYGLKSLQRRLNDTLKIPSIKSYEHIRLGTRCCVPPHREMLRQSPSSTNLSRWLVQRSGTSSLTESPVLRPSINQDWRSTSWENIQINLRLTLILDWAGAQVSTITDGLVDVEQKLPRGN